MQSSQLLDYDFKSWEGASLLLGGGGSWGKQAKNVLTS